VPSESTSRPDLRQRTAQRSLLFFFEARAGLGVTIAREIVQRTGGDIKISNRDGGGLRQVVELTKVQDQAAVKDAAE